MKWKLLGIDLFDYCLKINSYLSFCSYEISIPFESNSIFINIEHIDLLKSSVLTKNEKKYLQNILQKVNVI